MSNFYKTFKPLALNTLAQAAIIFIAGCSQIPKYERPAAPVAAQWPASTPAAVSSTQPLDWQSYFTDPTLRTLIEIALKNNRDLRMATLNTELALAQLGVRRADQFPTVNAALTGSRTPNSNGAINSAYAGGLTVTAYELDFFGRVGSLKEQALAQYMASAEAAQTAQISLIATVTQAWLALLADDELLAVTRQTLDSRAESLKLTALKLQNGAASELDQQLAQTLLESARVTLAQQTRQRALDENALVLLLGQPLPEAAQLAPASPTAAPHVSLSQLQLAELPAGLPSDLLTRRPDIRQAEQNLIASHANIGAARAAFFPRISLTAGVGSASTALANLFSSGSWGWTLAPQLMLPIFDAGRNQANLEAAQVGRDLAVAQYEKSIQNAFREVADALASRATLAAQVQASQALLAAETTRHHLTQLRLEHGAASQLEWLDAKRSLFSAQQTAVQTRLAYLQNQIALFKTLGGGSHMAQAASPTAN
ncbi:MAG: RND efflux system outer membrane lipoprotein NodT [Comamonadaceae bacterium]|nr:MAG: RND efflux system outer membrane lipoprotein NodT [Comamonadaceae bacterium]